MNALHLSVAEFRSLAARMTDLSADLLAGLDGARAFPEVSGAHTARAFAAPLPEQGLGAAALDALGEVLALSRAPTPRFYGYVLGSGEPVAALADLLASVLNQNVTAWRSAPAAVTIERHLVESIGGALAVVATAGTVNTGAIDPLADIASVCREQELWLHVDGAYGALAALAIPEAFRGLAAADSLSLDPHKWLYQPLDCGLLLYRSQDAARRAFSFTGDYAKSLACDPVEAFAFFDESVELSRRFRALKLWLSLRYHGLAAFRSAIRADLDHARNLAAAVSRAGELELLAPVGLSAVCFRCRPGERHRDADRFNAAVLRRVIERGRVYLSNATLKGRFALRACFVNHRTTDRDVAEIVPEVLQAAREVSGPGPPRNCASC